MGDLDAFIGEFVVEGRENLSRLERDLIDLEQNPSSRDTLDSAFRSIHNLKGSAGFLALDKLEAVAHAGETLLSRLRAGTIVINPSIATALLAFVDYTNRALSALELTGLEPAADHSALVARLTDAGARTAAADAATADAPAHPTEAAAPAPVDGLTQDSRNSSRPARTAGNIRVDIGQMDQLMNLVGELVLARNEMLQSTVVQQHAGLSSTSQRLNLVTTQLQDGIMKTRMQPIDTVWNAFPRLVRDLALQEGKQVRLETEGQDTELDRSLIEAIKDPLTHLIRNAIDHGLELPDVRAARGKALEGAVVLRAFHEGGQVNIEVSDDGNGIDVAAVRAKAIERGLITAEQARQMSERDATNLIFVAGFSTAKRVTSISGRGVGMDVVKTNIEGIGGKVTIQSVRGMGTTLKIRIPLTLAIMPALIVRSGRARYAIPQVNVLELLRLEGDDGKSPIEQMQDAAVCRLRGELLPLVLLNAELDSPTGGGSDARTWAHLPRERVTIVVLQAEDRKFGLLVDEVDDTQEIVVKPLGRYLRGVPTFAGATIMGDGKVVLILDTHGLAVHAQVTGTAPVSNSIEAEPVQAPTALLLFEGPHQTRMAIPLTQAMRLEEFDRATLERRGADDVVQYRGDILPLVSLARLIPELRASSDRQSSIHEGSPVQTIVYAKDGRHVGVVVDQILDTIEADLSAWAHDPAGPHSTVIEGRVTEILDLDRLCARAAILAVRVPGWGAAA